MGADLIHNYAGRISNFPLDFRRLSAELPVPALALIGIVPRIAEFRPFGRSRRDKGGQASGEHKGTSTELAE